MKLILDMGEAYPAFFVGTQEDFVHDDPDYRASELEQFSEDAVEIPDDVAQRWLTARDAWDAAEKEIGDWLKARPEDSQTEKARRREGHRHE